MTRIITVTSGTDGHGKTSICANLAAELARRGRRVCLLDADGANANVSVSLGLDPDRTLKDLVLSGAALSDVLIGHGNGFDIVPASSNSDWMSTLTSEQLRRLAACLTELEAYDIVLVDSSCSRACNALSFALASAEIILVISTEIASHTGAYSLLRLLTARQPGSHIRVVLNRARTQTLGNLSYDHFQALAQFHLGVDLPLLGLVSEDECMRGGFDQHLAPVSRYPQAPAAQDIAMLADRLLVDQAYCQEAGFASRFLHAVGLEGSGEETLTELSHIASTARQGLRQRLEYLSERVEVLAKEVGQMRVDARDDAPASGLYGTGQRAGAESYSESWLAALAQDRESVTVQGESFSIYGIDRVDGGRQHVAWHSADDNPEPPESG